MKMEKLDSKQMPKVVGLGAVSVAVFGFAAFSFLGAATPPPARKADAKPSAPVEKPGVQVAANTLTPASLTAAGTAAPGAPGAPAAAPSLSLGGNGYNPDPFRSPFASDAVAMKKKDAPKAPLAKAGDAAKGVRMALNPAPPLPDVAIRSAQWGAPGVSVGPAAPAQLAPALPDRPAVQVTGVIAGEGVKEMATVRLGAEERIVQVGDHLGEKTAYKVRKIGTDGLVLGRGKDSFFVALGGKTPGEKPEAAK